MYKLLPENKNFLTGVAVPTSNPIIRQVYLMSPRLNKRGDGLRTAFKALEEFEKKEEQATSDRQRLLINIIIESLKQQYVLVFEGKSDFKEGSEEDWKEMICDLFCEDDLIVAVTSLRAGVLLSREKMLELSLGKTSLAQKN